MTTAMDILKLYKSREYSYLDAVRALVARGWSRTAAMSAINLA